VLGTPHDGAAWLVTPFSPSDLPRADDEDGLDQLLGLQSPILLTALSMSRRLQAAIERHEVEADELPRLVAALRGGGFFLDEREQVCASTAVGGLDPIWHVAVNDAGEICSAHRGRTALAVRRSALTSPGGRASISSAPQ
jgi:hypothetical protein